MEDCFENLKIQMGKKDHSCFGFYFVFHLKEKVSWVSYLMGMALELFDLWGNISYSFLSDNQQWGEHYSESDKLDWNLELLLSSLGN